MSSALNESMVIPTINPFSSKQDRSRQVASL